MTACGGKRGESGGGSSVVSAYSGGSGRRAIPRRSSSLC